MWTHKPQERDGKYFFDGQAVLTTEVTDTLSPEEILWIGLTLQRFVLQHSGADHLQVFECSDGRRILCLCRLSRLMKESGDYPQHYDTWTMMLPGEY